MTLEQSLNGGYPGLYGEVVTSDVYHIRDVDDIVSINDPTYIHEPGHRRGFNFIPDVVLDLGANVGIFSRYARSLFPDALIIAVEPDADNCAVFRANTYDPKTILIQKAIGKGKVFRVPNATNGAMEVYLSQSAGFNKKQLSSYEETKVESILLTDLRQYIKEGDKVLLKIDIEGSETSIFSDIPSMEMLKTFHYITMELHNYAADTLKWAAVTKITDAALDELGETHNVIIDHIYVYATKK